MAMCDVCFQLKRSLSVVGLDDIQGPSKVTTKGRPKSKEAWRCTGEVLQEIYSEEEQECRFAGGSFGGLLKYGLRCSGLPVRIWWLHVFVKLVRQQLESVGNGFEYL
ncbi:uncharacterized protein [Arachis hypogaea]|uniref:uncharacterized protein n=1 Tax=Arachis hypogaea TaxID=3818 RepID=UPI003B21C81D